MLRNVAFVALGIAALACGRGPTGPSPVPAATPVAVDWTQPSGDLLDYYVSETGEAPAQPGPDGRPNPAKSSAFVVVGDRLVLCLYGSCANRFRQWFRLEGDEIRYVLDERPGAWYETAGSQDVGVTWFRRDWAVGQTVSHLGDRSPGDEGYELVTNCKGNLGATPYREVDTVAWAGVRDWGGTAGRRHTVLLVRSVPTPGGTYVERSWMARGLGMVSWDTGVDAKAVNVLVAPAASLGYRASDVPAHACGW